MAEGKRVFTQEDIMKLLDGLYTQVLNGIPIVSPPVDKMASDAMLCYGLGGEGSDRKE